MKKNILVFSCILIHLLASAKTAQLRITPSILCQIWNEMGCPDQTIEKAGYKLVAEKKYEIGFDKYFTYGCTISISSSGNIKSVKATVTNGYASYIEIGASIGLCYSISVTFLSKKGRQAFVSLLKKNGYRLTRKDQYDWGIIENVWERRSDNSCIMQEGNCFYINDGPCA